MGRIPPQGLSTVETTPLLSETSTTAPAIANVDAASVQRQSSVGRLTRDSGPLIVAGLLQHSISMLNIFSVGHLGAVAIGSVSLAIMTANMTGYAVYQGLASALDTLCAQAYGSGKKQLVGLYAQKMLVFLWATTVLIGLVWLNGEAILNRLVPDAQTAHLAGQYLRILLIGAPGYAAFECGKRFLQAQDMFDAQMRILVLAVPLHALINWLLVWKLGLGFVGAPLSIAMTHNMLPILGILYVALVDGRAHECWGGLSREALLGWGVMVRLALPGLLMLEAEFLAFELVTLAASHMSPLQLAAQGILSPLVALTVQAPLAVSVASATRVANMIGAGLPRLAREYAKKAAAYALVVGVINSLAMLGLGRLIVRCITNDRGVISRADETIPVIASFQVFDSLTATLNGSLRGIGRQAVGGTISLFCYYGLAVPVGFLWAFVWARGLAGLWGGIVLALAVNSAAAGIVQFRMLSWDAAAEAAAQRNTEAVSVA